MGTVAANVSAICKLDASTFICGNNDGMIFTFDTQTKEIRNLLQLASGESIQELSVDENILGIIADDNCYRVNLDNLSGGEKHIGENVSHMLDPFKLFLCDGGFFATCPRDKEEGAIERRMDYFQGENLYDNIGACLVINKYMSTANIFTLRLDDFTSWKEDTFSFDGDFFNEVGRELEEHPVECDDFDEEGVEQEMVMVSMLPKHLVQSAHHKFTYLDFVKLYESSEKDNPFVVSGGRDRRIIITDFNSHKVFLDKHVDNVPRCCCHNDEKIFVGCDEGEIVIINKSTYDAEVISLGDVRFRHIDALAQGRYIVAGNDDNAVFCFDSQEMEVVGFEQLDERLKEVQILQGNAVALGTEGSMVNIEF